MQELNATIYQNIYLFETELIVLVSDQRSNGAATVVQHASELLVVDDAIPVGVGRHQHLVHLGLLHFLAHAHHYILELIR